MPSTVQGLVRRTVASTVAKMSGAHVELNRLNLLTVPDQSALGMTLVTLLDSVLEGRLRTLAVSGAAIGEQRARMANRHTLILPNGVISGPESQVDDASLVRRANPST